MAAALPCQAKPPHPLRGQLTPATATAALGEVVVFVLELETAEPFARVAVRLRPPVGTTLARGNAEAEVSGLVPGQARTFEYALRVDSAGEKEVWAEAEVLGLEGEVVRRQFRAVVNPDPSRKSPEPVIRTDPQGRRYRLQGVPLSR